METFKEYQKQEKQLVLAHFTHGDAYRLGSYLSNLAVENNYPIEINIEVNGEVIYKYVNDGACPSNHWWAERKKNVVRRFHMSSAALTAKLKEKDETFKEHYGDDTDYAVVQGAFPIRVESVGLIGIIAISGLTSDEDHELAYKGLQYLKNNE